MKDFLKLPSEIQETLIHTAERSLPFIDTVIEKDIWVCKLLEIIFILPYKIVFKGGTSLSKGYGLINRFSEDVDITIDYSQFREEPIKISEVSRSKLKKISAELKDSLYDFSHNTLIPHIKRHLNPYITESELEIKVSNHGEQVRVYYPSVLQDKEPYLRDHILLEFGARNNIEPQEICNIHPYLDRVLDKGYLLPKPKVPTLSPIRTLWEKLTLIHVECQRNKLTHSADRLSRHWYDAFMLNKSWVGGELLNNQDILTQVIHHKKAFYYASYANYDDCLSGSFFLVPKEKALLSLEDDYLQMCKSGMFTDSPPKFTDIISELKRLEKKINSIIGP